MKTIYLDKTMPKDTSLQLSASIGCYAYWMQGLARRVDCCESSKTLKDETSA